jgi:transcriptional regulator with XRE-family HTH domain
MTIAGRLEDSALPGERPRERRRTLRLETQGALASGAAANVLVHNVSATGLLIESDVALMPDETIEIDLPHAGPTLARIVWASGRLFGCQFEAPVSAAALSAAQLRSAVAAPVGLAPPSGGESFGLRLRRLRQERGLSLSRIAAQLGVSKPTVWAWEQGKARPVEARMPALAELLGIDRAELMAGTPGHGLNETIARARSHIAQAAGVSTVTVRIMIEL